MGIRREISGLAADILCFGLQQAAVSRIELRAAAQFPAIVFAERGVAGFLPFCSDHVTAELNLAELENGRARSLRKSQSCAKTKREARNLRRVSRARRLQGFRCRS